jgi:hypothetical protein
VPITQTEFDHIADYKGPRGIDRRFGVTPDQAVWAVNTGWVVNVPDGYSVLYAHPFNYRAEAFRTIPGVVEAEPIPYMFRVPVVVTVDRGSVQFDEPLAQIVPFKRSEDPVEAVVDVIEEEPDPDERATAES